LDPPTQQIVAVADQQEFRQYCTPINYVEDSLIALPSREIEEATPACPEETENCDEGLAQPV